MGLLSLAIWTPITFGLFLLAFGRDEQARVVRWIALVGSVVSLFVTLPIYTGFQNGTSAMQFVENVPWIARFNVNYHLGVDGISLWFVLLTAFINLVVVIASWESITERVNQYMASFLILSGIGIVFSLPLGVLLALGRRSDLPVVHMLCVVMIEFVRGVPLITILFMANVMLPFFLPPGVEFNVLLRVLLGVTIFAAAYMAEVVRGGLQALPKGQYEGAMAMGLGYWQMMRLIILPQALRIAIPGIVNNFISLTQDTTLVAIVGLYDFLNIVRAGSRDTNWLGTEIEGYVFCALVYWIFCFAMSRYSMHLERKLHTGHQKR